MLYYVYVICKDSGFLMKKKGRFRYKIGLIVLFRHKNRYICAKIREIMAESSQLSVPPFEKVSLVELANRYGRHGLIAVDSDTCGFFLCEQGTVRLLQNNHIHELQAGDVYIHTPSSFVHLLSHSRDVKGIIVKTTLDVVLPLLSKINLRSLMMLRSAPCFRLSPGQRRSIESFTQLASEKYDHYMQCTAGILRDVLYHQLIALSEAYAFELVKCYMEGRPDMQPPVSRRSDVFQNFMLSLTRNFKRERGARFYAEEQHISTRYMCALIKEESGTSVSEWVAEYVIAHSRQLLAYSNKSVKQIAQELNFPDQSFFGKYFKQHTGLSPKEFRKRKKRGAAEPSATPR